MFREKDSTKACAELRERIFYREESLWYFDTREGIQFGPYETQDEAIAARRAFIQCITQDNFESDTAVFCEDIEISAA